MRALFCYRCGEVSWHDKNMCTRCGKNKVGEIETNDIQVKCPCCSAYFYFPADHPIHSRHQLELLPPISREIHPEIADDDEGVV